MNNQNPLFETYYTLLEVPIYADITKVRSAYRKLVLKYHPDKNGTQFEEQFLKIQNAYSTLSNPLLKELYDQKIRLHIKKYQTENAAHLLISLNSAFQKKDFKEASELAQKCIKLKVHQKEACEILIKINQIKNQPEPISLRKAVNIKEIEAKSIKTLTIQSISIDSFIIHTIYWFFLIISCFYIILAKEIPLTTNFLISEWTSGLISMLILNGIALGIWMNIQNKRALFSSLIKNLIFFIIPFWILLPIYYSKIEKQSLLFFVITIFSFSVSLGFDNPLAFVQTIIWGGNVMIPGLLVAYKITSFVQSKRI